MSTTPPPRYPCALQRSAASRQLLLPSPPVGSLETTFQRPPPSPNSGSSSLQLPSEEGVLNITTFQPVSQPPSPPPLLTLPPPMMTNDVEIDMHHVELMDIRRGNAALALLALSVLQVFMIFFFIVAVVMAVMSFK